MPNKHHITPHNVNLYVVSAVPQCTYVYTGANNLCCSKCAAGCMKSVSQPELQVHPVLTSM